MATLLNYRPVQIYCLLSIVIIIRFWYYQYPILTTYSVINMPYFKYSILSIFYFTNILLYQRVIHFVLCILIKIVVPSVCHYYQFLLEQSIKNVFNNFFESFRSVFKYRQGQFWNWLYQGSIKEISNQMLGFNAICSHLHQNCSSSAETGNSYYNYVFSGEDDGGMFIEQRLALFVCIVYFLTKLNFFFISFIGMDVDKLKNQSRCGIVLIYIPRVVFIMYTRACVR